MLWTGPRACLYVTLIACVQLCLATPPQQEGWFRLWQEGGCKKCQQQDCPPVPINCPAGLALDNCGCCLQCGNVEGQLCDPDGAGNFHGRCGEGLRCKWERHGERDNGTPEPKCVCWSDGSVCGSDGHTYTSPCQLREAASRADAVLRQVGLGPCFSAPQIMHAPRDQTNYTGNNVIFGCQVSAFPLPHLSWRKKGIDNYLPGDDVHVSVQVRGGPERYTVSSWLQILGLRTSDAGLYFCVSRNKLGESLASARLTVLWQALGAPDGYQEEGAQHYYGATEEVGNAEELMWAGRK